MLMAITLISLPTKALAFERMFGSYRVEAPAAPVIDSGTGIAFAWNGGKTFTGGGTSVTSADFAYKPSTGNLITVGTVAGGTFTNCTDNRGNVYQQDNFDDRLGGPTAVWHFVATATYNGTYTLTCGWTATSSGLMGILVSSNSHSSVSVDVTTKSFNNNGGFVITAGTSPTTSSTCGLWFTSVIVGSGLNDAITERHPALLVAEEQDGSSYQEGTIAYSTTNVANATTFMNWDLAGSSNYGSATVGYKTTP